MPRSFNIAVIAKETALQQSLAFALEAEGFKVETFQSWSQAESRLGEMICIVVDQDVIKDDAMARAAIRDSGLPIALLTDQADPPCSANTQVLTKPLTGFDVAAAAGKFLAAADTASQQARESL